MREITYTGRLRINEGEPEGIFLGDEALAQTIIDEMAESGNYLWVRYYIADHFLDRETAEVEWLNSVEGVGDLTWEVHYGDSTGYLWTDEEINVGGHDLIQELTRFAQLGRYILLIIGYARNSK